MVHTLTVIRFVFAWLLLLAVIVACGEEPAPQATVTELPVEPSPSTPAVEATVTEIPVEPSPSTPAAVPGDETPAATQAPVTPTEAEATAEATPDVEATLTATTTVTATAAAITGTERFAPGQQATVTLADGDFAAFPFSGAALETLLFFAEPEDDLDVDLAVYEAGVTAESDLSTLTPLVEANSGAADVPEALVFVPDEEGDFSLVLAATGSGGATVHFFDVQTQGTANTLPAGEVNTGQFYSNISRPVLIFVDPVAEADIVIRAATAEGEVLAESNYGGPGAAEVLFMLPPQSAGFAFQISEATGAAASYEMAVISLE